MPIASLKFVILDLQELLSVIPQLLYFGQYVLYSTTCKFYICFLVFLTDDVCRTMLLLDGTELRSCVDRSVPR